MCEICKSEGTDEQRTELAQQLREAFDAYIAFASRPIEPDSEEYWVDAFVAMRALNFATMTILPNAWGFSANSIILQVLEREGAPVEPGCPFIT